MSTSHAAQASTAAKIDRLRIDTIRTLSMDAVQQAPAPLVYTIWNRIMQCDPPEHLVLMRAMPGRVTQRLAGANEVVEAYRSRPRKTCWAGRERER